MGMQRAYLFPVFVSSFIVVLIALHTVPTTPSFADQDVALIPKADEPEQLLEIEAYEDGDYGFDVAIPAGWTRIVTADLESDLAVLEPGYAIGFESPSQGGDDHFADYVLIEILPGTDSGVFSTDGANRRMINIDGKPAWIDKLDINSAGFGKGDVDLTVFQAELVGLGYTVGLYAIGETDRQDLMSAAFQVMIQTFRFNIQPYSIV